MDFNFRGLFQWFADPHRKTHYRFQCPGVERIEKKYGNLCVLVQGCVTENGKSKVKYQQIFDLREGEDIDIRQDGSYVVIFPR